MVAENRERCGDGTLYSARLGLRGGRDYSWESVLMMGHVANIGVHAWAWGGVGLGSVVVAAPGAATI